LCKNTHRSLDVCARDGLISPRRAFSSLPEHEQRGENEGYRQRRSANSQRRRGLPINEQHDAAGRNDESANQTRAIEPIRTRRPRTTTRNISSSTEHRNRSSRERKPKEHRDSAGRSRDADY
jgi:hypothetical protein